MNMLLQGLSNQEIADKLFIEEKTVKFHLTNIYPIEGVKTRAQLIVKHLGAKVSAEDVRDFAKLMFK